MPEFWERDYREGGVSPKILDDLSLKLQDVKTTTERTNTKVDDVAQDVAIVTKGVEVVKRQAWPIWILVVAVFALGGFMQDTRSRWQALMDRQEQQASQMDKLTEILTQQQTTNALLSQAIKANEQRLTRMEDRQIR